MNEKQTIYANQISRLDKLGKLYEEVAVKGKATWQDAQIAFNNYCRVQQIKFETTVQLLNVDK